MKIPTKYSAGVTTLGHVLDTRCHTTNIIRGAAAAGGRAQQQQGGDTAAAAATTTAPTRRSNTRTRTRVPDSDSSRMAQSSSRYLNGMPCGSPSHGRHSLIAGLELCSIPHYTGLGDIGQKRRVLGQNACAARWNLFIAAYQTGSADILRSGQPMARIRDPTMPTLLQQLPSVKVCFAGGAHEQATGLALPCDTCQTPSRPHPKRDARGIVGIKRLKR